MPIIRGPEQLAVFRNSWDGGKVLELLRQHGGRLRINWSVGVGKSHNIDQVIEAAIASKHYDLVISLSPTRQIIEERDWVRAPPTGVRVVNLKPRPADDCGPDLDLSWQYYERNNLGALGRMELCNQCLHSSKCSWPRQFGKSLQGVKVIFGTQAHLERSPYFLDQLSQWSGAERVLVVIDEANFILTPFKRSISQKSLKIFVDILQKMTPQQDGKNHNRWVYLSELLLEVNTEDLRSFDWTFPLMASSWTLRIQQLGHQDHSTSFYYPVYDLIHFGRAPLESRERALNGDILFSSIPEISMDFILYSGSSNHDFAKYRLGVDLASPFDEYRFEHPKTAWFNIASRLGARKYFKKNSPQILDFFAGLVAKRLIEGKRPLLIAKKHFVPFCAREMESRLRKQQLNVRVLTSGWTAGLINDRQVVPLIHYGIIGINLFEDFDCAYCLTGYYINEDTLNGVLQDLLGSDHQIPLKISTDGRPCRRKAGVLNLADQAYDIHFLAQCALEQQEMGTVLQAIGRVRPYTKPREVITFQCTEHPDHEYTREFITLQEARDYFGIQSQRSNKSASTGSQVQGLKRQGLTQKAVAEQMQVSLRTVKRHWNQNHSGGHDSL